MRSVPPRTLTPLALVVLKLLHEHDMHPYEIQQLIHDRCTDHVIKLRAGSLYHTIERLHRLGLIQPVETSRSGRRPERTVYALTDNGRDEFRAGLRALIRYPEPEYPVFGAAADMLHAINPQDAVPLLEDRVVALQTTLAALEQLLASLSKRGLDRIKIIEIEYAQHLHRAELAWVGDLVEDIRSGALNWSAPQAEPVGAAATGDQHPQPTNPITEEDAS